LTTLFDPGAPPEILARLERLTPASPAQWGKMNVAQMLCHVARSLHTATGALVAPPLPWPVRLLGRLIKRRALGDAVLKHNAPTSTALKVVDPCEFAAEKAAFVGALRIITAGPHTVTAADHVLFGPMTATEWGRLMYKHIDHHFRQFGV
jgi:hypothetical protein